MKTIKTIFVLSLITLVTISCKKEKNETVQGKGYLKLNVINMQIKEEPIKKLKSAIAVIDNFNVTIYNLSNEVIFHYENVIDLPEKIELNAGEYYVVSSFGNYNEVGFDLPYYYGRSDNFTIDVEETKSVDLLCEIANCAVSIEYSATIQNSFIDYYTIVSSASGSINYDSNETRNGFFPLEKLNIQALFSYELMDGSVDHKILEGSIEEPRVGKLYEINLDASLNEGELVFNLSASDELEPVSLVLSESYSDLSGAQYGDLIITEIMYDPISMSDTYGEWIELYNTTTDTINLNNLVIRKSTSLHVISEDVFILPNDYMVLAKTDSAVGVTCYTYGSSISLNNSGSDLGIYTYGTDGSNGNEICSLIYDDGVTFPEGAGASISLSPSHLNVEDAKDGANWCVGIDVYSTGDLGSPGVGNTECE